MDDDEDIEIVIDDDDSQMSDAIDINILPDDSVWDDIPESVAEESSDEWSNGELTLDDDDDVFVSDSNEENSDDYSEPLPDPDTETDLEESAPEDVPDDEDEDEEAAPEEL